jgi:hypothetical protein
VNEWARGMTTTRPYMDTRDKRRRGAHRTVVIKPSFRPNSSLMTFASGARQLVVHDAFDTTFWSCMPTT